MVSKLRPFSYVFVPKKHQNHHLFNSVKTWQKYAVKMVGKNQKLTPKNAVFCEKLIKKTGIFLAFLIPSFSVRFHLFNKNLYKFI